MAAGGGQAIPAFDNLAKGVNYEVDAALRGIQNGKFPTMGPTPRVMLNAMKLSSGMNIPQGPINTMLESPSATLGIDDSPLVKAFTPTQVMSQQQTQQPQMQVQPTAVMTPQAPMQTPTQSPVASPVSSTSSTSAPGYLSGAASSTSTNTKTGIGNQGIV